MKIWDRGTYTRAEVAADEGRGRASTASACSGRYALFPIGASEPRKDWMIHRMDPPVDPTAEPMPEHVVPMLARLVDAAGATRTRWAFEVKWDGVRAIARSEPGRLRLDNAQRQRHHRRAIPSCARLNRALSSHSAILDGEVVAFDARRPAELRARSSRACTSRCETRSRAAGQGRAGDLRRSSTCSGSTATRCMELPYERAPRARSPGSSSTASAGGCPTTRGDGAALLAATREQGLEGDRRQAAGLAATSPGARSGALAEDQERRAPGGRRSAAGAGEGRAQGPHRRAARRRARRRTATLRYAGRVGTGFTERRARPPGGAARAARARRLAVRAPGAEVPRGARLRGARARRRGRVPRVDAGWPAARAVLQGPARRQARRARRRRGRSQAATARVGGRELKLTNLDKVLYPEAGFAKRDVIDYYARIAPVLLPHLAGRPLTLKRYPNGVDAPFFYEKNAPSHRPEWVTTATAGDDRVRRSSTGEATLVWLANLADLELHTSLSRAARRRPPTMVAFDLDPGAPATVVRVLGRSRCCCRACSTGSGCSASPRPRARRACRSTCR